MAEKKSHETTETANAATYGEQPLWTTPMILEREGKKRKKSKKYSRGSKGLQRLILGVASAASRITGGFSRGTSTWVRRSKRSSRKKRDGLMRDAFENASRAFSKGSREASKAPREISKRFNTRSGWRVIRAAVPL